MIKDLNRYFDHTNLRPAATDEDIIKLSDEAVEYNFYAVCINPNRIELVGERLKGTGIKIVSVCGFPLGASLSSVKVKEAIENARLGIDELDMVADISMIKSGNFQKVETQIKEIRDSLPYNIILKVIIESGQLTKNEITEATKAVINGGAQFVKSSTGFFEAVDIEQIKTMKQAGSDQIEIKAAGGIRTLNQAIELINTGADRLGCSSSVEIMDEYYKLENKKFNNS